VEHTFGAELWLWDARAGSWTFVTVPPQVSAEIADEAAERGPRGGFGSIPVQVRIGEVRWRTSVFPDSASGCFVLPVKAAVRRANDVAPGDEVTVHLALA